MILKNVHSENPFLSAELTRIIHGYRRQGIGGSLSGLTTQLELCVSLLLQLALDSLELSENLLFLLNLLLSRVPLGGRALQHGLDVRLGIQTLAWKNQRQYVYW